MKNTLAYYPYLVAEKDGSILGYAYAGRLKGRAAYDWSCEVSIYIDRWYNVIWMEKIIGSHCSRQPPVRPAWDFK